ncbi:hypothetical protein ACHAWF_016495 [Thalassiosira exigua]
MTSFDEVIDDKLYGSNRKDSLASVPASTWSSSEASSPRSFYVSPSTSITGTFGSIEEKYFVEREPIHAGYHASIKMGINRDSMQRYAVKSIRKTGEVRLTDLHREVTLLREVNHANIVELADIYEDHYYLHLVTQLYTGGDLFDRIVQKKKSSDATCFEERQAAAIMYEILNALSYLHKNDIVHRDVKPENIVFETDKDGSPIRIVDFGFARKHFEDSFEPYMSTIVGTTHFLAPEVLRQKYDKSCDVWSAGVVAFAMLCGYLPFNGRSKKEVFDAIKRGKLQLRSRDWSGTSKDAKDFVRRLLRSNPKRRMTIEQALQHPWIKNHKSNEVAPKKEQRRKSLLTQQSSKSLLSLFGGKND